VNKRLINSVENNNDDDNHSDENNNDDKNNNHDNNDLKKLFDRKDVIIINSYTKNEYN
jgi:hypothetical protein